MNADPPANRARSFSLVEVIIAAGIFAAAVTGVIALLPALARQSGESVQSLAAQRLPDLLRSELTRLGAPGVDALAGEIPLMPATLSDGFPLVANRDATRLHSRDFLPPAAHQLAWDDQFFLVECWQFPDEPLAFNPTKGCLVLLVRVSWPHRLPGASAAVPAESRQEFLFTAALNR